MAGLKSVLAASSKAVDPALDALFSSSVGPVKDTSKPKYSSLITPKPRSEPTRKAVKPIQPEEVAAENDEDDESDDDTDGSSDDDEDEEEEEESDDKEEEEEVSAVEVQKAQKNKRKRKNREENEDLESKYLDQLADEMEEPAEKRARHEETEAKKPEDSQKDGQDGQDKEEEETPLIHESLLAKKDVSGDGAETTTADQAELDTEKASRTVFLSNVNLDAVTNKSARKTLLAYLASAEEAVKAEKEEKEEKEEEEEEGEKEKEGKEKEGKEKEEKEEAKDKETEEDDKKDKPSNEKSVVESLRFRSVPFASAGVPKRASYITKSVLDATAHATNAYAVYTTAAAARRAVRALNGTVVLGRHLRADSVAHPAAVDHRRCVFVGNLGFMDDEIDSSEGGGEQRKKKNKIPMDVEEGLWRTFGEHAGRVESVRVVRDAATRVGKGIAYVQFYDGTAVEAALLLAGRKFPPMLPRALRVSRCKAPQKTARAIERHAERQAERLGRRDAERSRKKRGDTAYAPKTTGEQTTAAGRAAKLLGRSGGAAAAAAASGGTSTDGSLVFEGMRARVGSSNLFKKGKNKGKGKRPPLDGKSSGNAKRQAARAASWRKKN